MLDIGFGLFEVSNSSNLGVEGMNPEYMYFVNCWEVTHMLGDGRVGVHYKNCDIIVYVEFYS